MSWSDAFHTWGQERSRSPIWVVEGVGASHSDGWDRGKDWSATTHRSSPVGAPRIVPGSVQLVGTEVQPVTWNVSVGGFMFDLMDCTSILSNLRRGNYMTLLLGDVRFATGDYERVAQGTLQDVSYVGGGRWRVMCGGFGSFLRSRMTGDADTVRFFSQLTESDVAASFTANSDTDIKVDSATGFDTFAAHDSVVRVEEDGQDPFYLRYSGTDTGASPDELTGVDTSDVLGTTQENTGTSTGVVHECGFLEGHPMNLLRRVLVSTGSGDNSDWDVYPKKWGAGIPQSFVNTDDISQWLNRMTVSSGSWSAQILIEEEQENGLAWLLGAFAPIGVFPVLRMGQVSARCALNPLDPGVSALTIRDKHVRRIESWSAFDSQVPVEYGYTRILTRNSSGVSASSNGESAEHTIKSHPGTRRKDVDLPFVYGNRSAIETEVASRLEPYHHIIPERLVLTTRTWRESRLVAGDWIELDLEMLTALGNPRHDYAGHPALVLRCDPFVGTGTRLTLGLWTESE